MTQFKALKLRNEFRLFFMEFRDGDRNWSYFKAQISPIIFIPTKSISNQCLPRHHFPIPVMTIS